MLAPRLHLSKGSEAGRNSNCIERPSPSDTPATRALFVQASHTRNPPTAHIAVFEREANLSTRAAIWQGPAHADGALWWQSYINLNDVLGHDETKRLERIVRGGYVIVQDDGVPWSRLKARDRMLRERDAQFWSKVGVGAQELLRSLATLAQPLSS